MATGDAWRSSNNTIDKVLQLQSAKVLPLAGGDNLRNTIGVLKQGDIDTGRVGIN